MKLMSTRRILLIVNVILIIAIVISAAFLFIKLF